MVQLERLTEIQHFFTKKKKKKKIFSKEYLWSDILTRFFFHVFDKILRFFFVLKTIVKLRKFKKREREIKINQNDRYTNCSK